MADELDGVDVTESKARRMDRRAVLKKGAVGAGMAGVIWAAPEIVGLATSPAYASASSSRTISNAPCTADLVFDLSIPCPPGGHGVKDFPATGNCPDQKVTVDTHWAVGTPHDTTASRPNAFNDVHAQDKGPWKTFHAGGNSDISPNRPPYIIVGIKRANANCSFETVEADTSFHGTNDFFFNPVTKQKFSDASQTLADISIGWASDPNERADLGAPLCVSDTGAHLHMKCI